MYDTYLIKEDDTIDSIASKYGISPEILRELNGYIFNLIPGNTLVVPRRRNDYFDYYTVSKGDTLYKIASDNNIEPSLLAQLNGINKSDYIYPNQTLLVPRTGTMLYITASGDTLSEIANGFKVPIDKLVEQNDNIYIQSEQLIVYRYK